MSDEGMPWYWLSFCDTSRPAGQRFLGVAVVPGRDVMEAAARAWLLDCNPGGEVYGHVIPAESGDPPQGYESRLLTRAECAAMMLLWHPEDPRLECASGFTADDPEAS